MFVNSERAGFGNYSDDIVILSVEYQNNAASYRYTTT